MTKITKLIYGLISMKLHSKILAINLFAIFYSQTINCQVIDSSLTDILNYSMKINLSDFSDSINSECILQFKVLALSSSFTFDLVNQRPDHTGMTVYNVERDSDKLKYWQDHDKLIVLNHEEAKPGDTLIYKIDYGGIPSDGLVISRNRFGKRTFFGDNWPDRARNWFPCNDFQSDKATVSFTIAAPSHYKVVANGSFTGIERLTNETTLWHWHEEIPISTKVIVFGAADFSVATDTTNKGIPVQSWVYTDNKNEGFTDYAPAADILRTFQKIIGKYPFEKLANVQSTTRYGGMENASCIFYAENSVNGKGNDEALLAHEIAHQWFGNSVTECNWFHLWLSEGFATFFANIYFEKRYGTSLFRKRLRNERDQAINWPGTLMMPIIPLNSINPMEQLNPVTYQKAGWVLQMLRNELGDTLFFKGIRNYYSQFINKIACTDDFKNIMESVSGKDLTHFFSQWLHMPGYPDLIIKCHFSDPQKNLFVDVEQKQNEIFDIPLEIETVEPNQIFKIHLTERNSSFSFSLDKVPVKINIDPGIKVFAKISQFDY
jgi:aminopeptidase N